KLLPHLECSLLEPYGIKEFIDSIGRTLVPHSFVVRTVRKQQLLVIAQKRSGIHQAFIPQEDQPSAWFKDSHKLCSRSLAVEPVCRLGRGYELDAFVLQHSCLGRATHADKTRKTA